LHKFFVKPNDINGDKIHIYEDAGHISRVLRLKRGDQIIVFDGMGGEYRCTLEMVDKSECVAGIDEVLQCTSEPNIRTVLFQGIPKSGKMETIIQKCTELGICEIYPVITKYTVVKLETAKDKAAKTARWQKVALEAAKQCGRGIVPVVHLPIAFEIAAAKMGALDLAIMPYEILGGKKDLRDTLSNIRNYGNIGFLVGPEGGFDESEAKLAELSGIKLIGLGERILRTETVGPAVLAIIMYENNEL